MYQYDNVISDHVHMKGWDFIPCLHEEAVHVGQRDGGAILDWMSKTMHSRSPFLACSRLLERGVKDRARRHAGANSCTTFSCHRNEFSYRSENCNRGELAPAWLALV